MEKTEERAAMGSRIIRMGLLTWGLLGLWSQALAQPAWGPVEKILGRTGEEEAGCLRIAVTRRDLNILVQGIPLEPGLALTSRFTFWEGGKDTLLRGQLVLAESEVSRALTQLGLLHLKVTALVAPLLGESPKVRSVYFTGEGRKTDLAQSLNWILSVTGFPPAQNQDLPSPTPALKDWASVEKILGPGSMEGKTLYYLFPRPGLESQAATVPPFFGPASDLHFQTMRNQMAATGAFALRAGEIDPILAIFRAHHIQATALENHWLSENPGVFFLHFWATGDPGELAAAFRVVLDSMK